MNEIKNKLAKYCKKAEETEHQQGMLIEQQRQEEREPCETITCIKVDDNDNSVSSSKKSCNACGASFAAQEHSVHFKIYWHGFNLQLKLKGVPIISKEEFLMCNANMLFDFKK